MLTDAIAQHYPTLKFNLAITRLAVPFAHGGWALQSLMTRVMTYLGSGAELDFSPINDKAFYLTDNAPDVLAPEEGEIDMSVIEGLIKELSWRLPIGLQNALTDFWGEPSDNGAHR
ncbi:hypothetical protein Pfra02_27660 [Pseudomonas fragi]|nr:hypothetical protein Pfra02_27660 [Pseudomonas fragi]